MHRALVTCLLALWLGACTGPEELPANPDALQIRGLQFENRSRTPVTSIELRVPVTGNFVSCGRIAPGARCASRFPEVAYAGHPIEVKWVQGGAEWSTGMTTMDLSSEVREAGAGEVRVVVIAPGSAGVVLVPSEGPDPLSLP